MKIPLHLSTPLLLKRAAVFSPACIALLGSSIATATALPTAAQQYLEQPVTIRAQDETMQSVLTSIESQTNIRFQYSRQLIGASRRVSIQAEGQPLGQVLHTLFDPLRIAYEPLASGIVLKPAAAADITVSGRVVDEKGAALPGVNVVVKGTSTGTQTDADGRYTLTAPDNATLAFSFVGFTIQEVPVSGRTTVDVSLAPDSQSLNEVVVVGYGTQRKADVTGAIGSVKAEEIANRPVANAEQSLQGKVAGVTITSNSGSPGAPPSIRIRGVTSVRSAGEDNEAANQPLFVVDGMFTNNIQYLSPYDIASIEVLKDASSLAIYGVRGANGVIIVTTKKGKSGKARISLNAYAGYQEIAKRVKMANATEYQTLLNEAIVNTTPNSTARFRNPGYDFGSGVNWFDEILQKGFIQDYQLSASGGSERSSYSISGGYNKQEGIVKGQDFERINFRINNEYRLTDRVRVGANVAVSRIKENITPGSVFGNAYNADPAQLVTNPLTGIYSYSNNQSVANPVAQLAYNNERNKGGRLVGNIYGEADLLKNLTFRSSFGTDLGYTENRVYVPVYFVSQNQRNDRSRLSRQTGTSSTWLWENTMTYNTQFGDDHRLTLLGGYTAQRDQVESLFGQRSDVPGYDEDLWYLNVGNAQGNVANNSASEYAFQSVLARANYALKDRYLITATFRADGSSRFSEGDRWGYFPALGLGWRLSEEDFIKNLGLFDNLKLRASYGIVGNVNVPSYQYYARINNGLGAIFGSGETLNIGKTETNPTVSQIRWEKINQLDVGFEIGVLDNRLTFEADYFDRRTNDLVTQVPVAVGALFRNIGTVDNKGFEFTLGWQGGSKEGFSYGINGNLSTLKNNIVSLGNGGQPIVGGSLNNGNVVTRSGVGTSIGEFYGYDVAGIFQTADEVASAPNQPGGKALGDLRFRDVNNDGVVDQQDRVSLGSPIPNLTYGLNTSAAYKGFDVAVDVQGVAGNKIYNGKKAVRFTNENFEASRLDRWTPSNPSSTEPRVSNNIPQVSSYFIESGSFVRFRTIQLGYTIPRSLTESFGVGGVRFYVNAFNPFTFTKYTGFSPEVGGNDAGRGIELNVVPVTRSYNAGINISL
ncbi:SusC/RagA family TonB-linked outer membrane protein [Hymenobacter sp. AT01-02]|uniref:SusC/RagA family TonB-linked outer membrane protein n=1 Tax=Hymenobacter sp. AT01-02 TaxID=1571877 RepID=UPI0006E270BF|nr:TonB-dependent receptor [Hymenobacter sp. AT01-02]